MHLWVRWFAEKKEQNLIVFLEYYQTIRALFWFRKAKTGNTVSLIVWISEVHQDIETVFPTLAIQTLKTWLFLEKFGSFWKQLLKRVGNTALNRTFQGQGYPRWTLDKCLISPWICSFDQGWTNLVLQNKKWKRNRVLYQRRNWVIIHRRFLVTID